tara:strand:- start:899 stop:1291 length:393 start_codon:yes stop_codon:yes gene_type:complete
MATVSTTVLGDLAGKLIINDDADTTAAVDVTGTTGSMYLIQIDATAGTPTTAEPACYVKIIDASGGVTGGGGSSSTPELVLYAPLGQVTTYVISGGWAFSSGLSLWAVQTAAVAGDASPTADVKVTILSS